MSLNDDQKDYMKSLGKISPEELCDCGWYRVNECRCDDAKKYTDARNGRNRSLIRLREALADNERLTTENSVGRILFDVLTHHTHVCGGRDCVGYMFEADSPTQWRCSYCQQIYDAFSSVSSKQEPSDD